MPLKRDDSEEPLWQVNSPADKVFGTIFIVLLTLLFFGVLYVDIVAICNALK